MKNRVCPSLFLILFIQTSVFSASQTAQQMRQWIADKNASANKRKINDKIDAYFVSCLAGMKAADGFTDPAGKIKIPVSIVKEIGAFKDDEKIYGGVIDSGQQGSPLFVFTDYAFYVIADNVYQAFINPAEKLNNDKDDFLVFNYGQLSEVQIQDLPQRRRYQIADASFTATLDSGVPECLDKILSYIKSEANIFRIYTAQPAEPVSIPFIKGHTLLIFTDQQKDLPAVGQSLDALAATKANAVCIVTNGQMKTFDSPQIVQSSKDDITRSVIQMARDRNLKIILKPMIDPQDQVWRAWINFFNQDGRQDLVQWQKWWESYEQFILHNARLAEEVKAEMFCIGCEMGSTEQFESQWRYLIRQVRDIYHGTLTYNINHWPLDQLKWWDALDVISISAYYHLEHYVQQAGRTTQQGNKLYQIPLEDMKAGFEIVKKNLKEYAEKWNKPVFFIECGVCNGKGCAREPWTHPSDDLIYDQQEQAIYYMAMFECFYDEPWFAGYAWWAWPTFLYDEEKAKTDVSFSVYGKAAQDIVRQWYAKARQDAVGLMPAQ